MNTPKGEADQIRYAEYALGVLDADERAAVAHEVETDEDAAAAVAAWQARLNPLAEGIAAVTPSPHLWERIERALPAQPLARARPWENLSLWRWIGIGASAVAASLLILVLRTPAPRPPTGAPEVTHGGFMAATLRQKDGTTRWTATIDLQHARLIVVPAAPVTLAQGRAPELWLIPSGQKPIPVGMVDGTQPVAITLDPTMLARLGRTAAFAVSIEPSGGSPTGQPTGPVIALGSISGVKVASG